MFDIHASFTVVHEDESFVFLIDNDYSKSVTNDAEYVCEKLLSSVTDRKKKRFIYRDTDRHWDEMVHNGFSFSYFSSLHTGDQALTILNQVQNKIF